MLALGITLLALATCWFAGRRAPAAGILAVLSWGYFYGILRANIEGTASYFIFDAAVVGFYLGVPWARYLRRPACLAIRGWTVALMLWPCLLFFFPVQHPLVQIVGLRGHIFFIPALLLGAGLALADLRPLCLGLCALNLAALGFGVAEYLLGVERFYPLNAVTQLIYISSDVAGGFLRIPATFANAHAYAGNMTASIPFIAGGLHVFSGRWTKALLFAGLAAAIAGVLMASTRLYFLMCAALLVAGVFLFGAARSRVILLVAVAGAALLAMTNPRFQRFKSLDLETAATRFEGSVNRGLFEVILDFPLGNGLGAGGTSLPYFIAPLVRNPISVENEYGRIALEQGLPGLALWLCFMGWYLARGKAFWSGPWKAGRLLAYVLTLGQLAAACIGTGMLTAIPGTFTFLLTLGWLTAPERATVSAGVAAAPRRTPGTLPGTQFLPSEYRP